MSLFIITVQKNKASKFVTLPVHIVRAYNLVAGDKLFMEPQNNGTILVYPPALVPRMIEAMKTAVHTNTPTYDKPNYTDTN